MVLSAGELALVGRLRSQANPRWPCFGALNLDFDRLPMMPATTPASESGAANGAVVTPNGYGGLYQSPAEHAKVALSL